MDSSRGTTSGCWLTTGVSQENTIYFVQVGCAVHVFQTYVAELTMVSYSGATVSTAATSLTADLWRAFVVYGPLDAADIQRFW